MRCIGTCQCIPYPRLVGARANSTRAASRITEAPLAFHSIQRYLLIYASRSFSFSPLTAGLFLGEMRVYMAQRGHSMQIMHVLIRWYAASVPTSIFFFRFSRVPLSLYRSFIVNLPDALCIGPVHLIRAGHGALGISSGRCDALWIWSMLYMFRQPGIGGREFAAGSVGLEFTTFAVPIRFVTLRFFNRNCVLFCCFIWLWYFCARFVIGLSIHTDNWVNWILKSDFNKIRYTAFCCFWRFAEIRIIWLQNYNTFWYIYKEDDDKIFWKGIIVHLFHVCTPGLE